MSEERIGIENANHGRKLYQRRGVRYTKNEAASTPFWEAGVPKSAENSKDSCQGGGPGGGSSLFPASQAGRPHQPGQESSLALLTWRQLGLSALGPP